MHTTYGMRCIYSSQGRNNERARSRCAAKTTAGVCTASPVRNGSKMDVYLDLDPCLLGCCKWSVWVDLVVVVFGCVVFGFGFVGLGCVVFGFGFVGLGCVVFGLLDGTGCALIGPLAGHPFSGIDFSGRHQGVSGCVEGYLDACLVGGMETCCSGVMLAGWLLVGLDVFWILGMRTGDFLCFGNCFEHALGTAMSFLIAFACKYCSGLVSLRCVCVCF